MYCLKCGKKYTKNAKYCSDCGSETSNTNDAKTDRGSKVKRLLVGLIMLLVSLAALFAISGAVLRKISQIDGNSGKAKVGNLEFGSYKIEKIDCESLKINNPLNCVIPSGYGMYVAKIDIKNIGSSDYLMKDSIYNFIHTENVGTDGRGLSSEIFEKFGSNGKDTVINKNSTAAVQLPFIANKNLTTAKIVITPDSFYEVNYMIDLPK